MDFCIMRYWISCTCENKCFTFISYLETSRFVQSVKYDWFWCRSNRSFVFLLNVARYWLLCHLFPLYYSKTNLCLWLSASVATKLQCVTSLSVFFFSWTVCSASCDWEKLKFYVFETQNPKVVFPAICVSIADLLTFFYLSPHYKSKKNKNQVFIQYFKNLLIYSNALTCTVSFVVLHKHPLWISAYVAPFGTCFSCVLFCTHACK